MRLRLAIWILLPCLWLARPALLAVYAQDPTAPGAQPAGGQPAAAPDGAAPPADAATAAPAPKLDKYNDSHSVPRFKSPSISWLKLAGVFILFLIWVRSAD